MIEGGFCEKKDLCRVNFELDNLKPFPHLAFPHFPTPKNGPKQHSFDGELIASLMPKGSKAVVLWRPLDKLCEGANFAIIVIKVDRSNYSQLRRSIVSRRSRRHRLCLFCLRNSAQYLRLRHFAIPADYFES